MAGPTAVGAGSMPQRPVLDGAVFAPGDLIAGRYRVVRVLGDGGCGVVFEARDSELGDTVALKTLRPILASSAVAAERFRREIQNARKVTHPNVCRIFDIGIETARGAPRLFLTMELLPGESLQRRLEAGRPFTTAEALPVVMQIASGLQAAHDAGVIHRDLKPANIMLGPERVVITDFGIAISDGSADPRLTSTGEIVGTPDYMAPEQADARSASAASDVYALGLVLFEMLTLRLPFEPATSPIGTLLKRRREAPRSLRQDRPDADPVWESVIARCLEREPGRRFQRVADVALALGDRATSGADGEELVHRRGPGLSKLDTLV